MPLRIMRRITFCAGHRLLGHDGKCKNLHGHNYVVEFHVTGHEQDEIGRILDFKLLKERCKGWLDEHWDHAFILWAKDDNALAAVRTVGTRFQSLEEQVATVGLGHVQNRDAPHRGIRRIHVPDEQLLAIY